MNEINVVDNVEILELKLFNIHIEASLPIQSTLQFMLKTGRVVETDYAFMDNWEVFELIQSSEGIIAPAWNVLEDAALRKFLQGIQPLVSPAERWQPR